MTIPVLQSPDSKFGISTAAPANVIKTPNTTSPTAGSFSRLYREWGSSFKNARPGKMYANGIAENKPFKERNI